MANQGLLLSGDVEKIPDLARERRQALIIIYFPGRNQQRQGAITVRKQLGETKRTFHVPIYGMFSLKVCVPEINGEQLAMQ